MIYWSTSIYKCYRYLNLAAQELKTQNWNNKDDGIGLSVILHSEDKGFNLLIQHLWVVLQYGPAIKSIVFHKINNYVTSFH